VFDSCKVVKDPSTGRPTANWPLFWSDGPIGAYSVADTGAFVLEALKHPETWLDKDLRIQADIFTPREYVRCVNEVSGKEVRLVEVTREAFLAMKDLKEYYELWGK
jgi:hypothetical protein